jgi:hypothetical protein
MFFTFEKKIMNKGNVFSVLIIFLSCISIGQNNVWHIGAYLIPIEAGWQESSFKVDFTSGVPVASSNGGSIDYYESVSVVTDQYGDERMYSDGIKIMDASHSLMYGAPLVLSGTQSGNTGSSTQGALSVSDRNNPDIIHFFTANAIDGNQSGLRYHRIDLSMPGNGTPIDPLGEVVVYDSLLNLNSSEMLTSYGSCESDSVWIIAHESQSYNFIKILLTSNVESVTTQHVTTSNAFGNDFLSAKGRGSLDVNPEGTRIAFTGGKIGTFIFDFNAFTGDISNPKQVLIEKYGMSLLYEGYGTEFSPDGSKLYVTSFMANEILQYDIEKDTSYILGCSGPASIERGPDGNIYVAKMTQLVSQSLGRISNPNNLFNPYNNAFYDENAIAFPSGLTNAYVSYALPQDNICYNTIITSTKTDFVAEEANLYPNPAKDYVFNSLGEEFVFYNYLGAEVFKSNETKINVSNLVDGVYFVKSEGAFTRLVISK